MNHFKEKSVSEHIVEARRKGAKASQELHGTEMSGSIHSFLDASKEAAIVFTLLVFIEHPPMISLFAIAFGFAFWKGARGFLLGQERLERLHTIISQEKWEIEHNRADEKKELIEMYSQKGLKGKLLDDVIEVLMADDHRLLQVMIEEELGLTLRSTEHPLLQGCGAFLGAAFSAAIIISLASFIPLLYITILAGAIVSICGLISAALQKINKLETTLHYIAATILTFGGIHFLLQIIRGE